MYCSASGTAGTTSDYINYVELNGVINNSGKEGYLLYTADTIFLTEGSTYTLTAKMAAAFASDSCGAWIDYNNDATFDVSEQIIMSQYASRTSTGTFTVPTLTQVEDTVRLRVRDSYFSDPDPCGNDAGEVEDYILIIKKCSSPITTLTERTCDSYTWNVNGETYLKSGVYRDTIQNQALCDSILELTLTIDNSFRDTSYVSACKNYTWGVNGITYSGSGEYQKIYTSASGCDSIFTLQLTINQAADSTFNETACFAYLWSANGVTYTASGIYKDTITTVSGCDSILLLNLVIDSVDVGVSKNANVLTADQGGVTYQWLDCSIGMQEISGATSQSYIADKNGSYAVIITDGNCSDTSACISVTSIGIGDNIMDDVFVIYPNPNTGTFSITFDVKQPTVKIRLISIDGKQILLDNRRDVKSLDYKINVAPGKYFILIETNDGERIKEIIIQ